MLRVYIVVTAIIATTEACTGWHMFYGNKHCYKVFCKEVEWEAAKKHCEELGGYLASIGDAEENNFVGSLAGNMYARVWIGYKRTTPHQRPFYWVDGSKTGFESWSSRTSEPNNARGDEDCTYMLTYAHLSRLEWNDHYCTFLSDYVCERNDCFDLPE
ncbi:hypothetical protein Y032_0010g996 [Ancylostoma ceylanicum]|uniref:C-type lectin domain-containing protein n=1 Tax=Ancylostoma ceylanicum TaxID=53326 RepID=A0A016VHR1_9BILA|nr:hypothetical protein Y032_0010g996 [Ancylostoma ceylanicum]